MPFPKRTNKKKLAMIKLIIDQETKTDKKSIKQLSEASVRYTKNGKPISRDTISNALKYIEDIRYSDKSRGQKGFQIVSKKNYNNYIEIIKSKKNAIRRINEYYAAVIKNYREGRGIISRAKKLLVPEPDGKGIREYDLEYPMIFPSRAVDLEVFLGEFTDGKTEVEKREEGQKALEALRKMITQRKIKRESC